MTTKNRLILLGAIILACAGCTTQKPPVVVAKNQPRVISKTALAGTLLILDRAISVNPDCTPATMATIRIVQEPEHGNLVIAHRKDYPSFPKYVQRSECNKIKLPGVFADYTADDGFTGSDQATIEMITASGNDTVLKYLITVK